MFRRVFRGLGFGTFVAAAVMGCSQGGVGGVVGSPSPPTATTATVNVTLQEWAVAPDVATAKAGAITFALTNKGPADVHEFVVIKTDLAPDKLPVDAKGAVSETGAGMTVIGEVEDVALGATPKLELTLAAGAYALICNIYDETEKEAHYQMGMRTAFKVE